MFWPVLFALVAAVPAAPVDPRIFAEKAVGEPASFLVVLREQADLSGAATIADRVERRRFVYETLRAQAEASQAPLKEKLRAAGARFRPHFLVNLIEVEADEATALRLAAEPGVAKVAANRPARLQRIAPEPGLRLRASAGIEPNIELIGAPDVWNSGFTGQGVVVGVADSGIEWFHPALLRQYRGWDGVAASHAYNWHDAIHDANPSNFCGSDSPEPCDDEGHGTAVAGLAVGDDGEGNRIGAAPGARLIGCRNMDIGTGTPARYIECFEFFLAPTDANGENPRPDLGADVVNNSWTCPAFEGCTDIDVLRTAVEAMRAAGIAETFAAGNAGPGCSTVAEVPAIYDAAFSIGATDLSDTIAVFSSRGPVARDASGRLKPDIVAPGVGIRSCSTGRGSNSYTTFGGTSGASPQVAGAIALLWSALPRLAGDVESTEEILAASAVPLTSGTDCGGLSGAEIPNPVYGWGRLDVAAAHARALNHSTPVRTGRERPETRVVPPRP
jgi:subtilisin family serine protease